MKVGIIGAGIAGLTCGYRLAKKGISSIIFEKEAIVGGRVPYCGTRLTESFHPRLLSLIKELGLEELLIRLQAKEQVFFTKGGELIDKEKIISGVENFSLEEKKCLEKLNALMAGWKFDVKNPDKELIKLREISFQEFLKDCPKRVKETFIEPALAFVQEENLETVGAEFGASLLKFGQETIFGEPFVFEENNPSAVVNILAFETEKMGSKILKATKVEGVKKEGGKFSIVFRKLGEEVQTIEVDKVVFATPLFETGRIFPELKMEEIDGKIEYKRSKCFFVDGELKYPEVKVIMGMPGNPANLLALFNVVAETQLVYPVDQTQKIDLEFFYNNYSIVSEYNLNPSTLVIKPGAKISGPTTSVEGAFICGDFYYYPFLETSVATAEMVADLIN